MEKEFKESAEESNRKSMKELKEAREELAVQKRDLAEMKMKFLLAAKEKEKADADKSKDKTGERIGAWQVDDRSRSSRRVAEKAGR